jgi:tetratricopeptide (TPR) repeat protein
MADRVKPTAQQIQQAVDQAVALHQAGRVPEAERIYRQVLSLDPNHADALHLLGLIAHHAAHREEALKLIGRAIGVAPGVPLYHMNVSKVYRALGRLDEAVASASRAVQLNGHFVEAVVELAAALRSAGQLDEAERVSRRAVALAPDRAEAHGVLGNTLGDLGKLEEAIACYERTLRLRPGWGEAMCNLGDTLSKLGRFDESEPLLREACRLTPDVGEPFFNLSLLLLTRGDFAEGWPLYEWRWRQIGMSAPESGRPAWDGSPLDGRTILLHSEQGLGDSIQFVRYAPMLKSERGAGRVIFACEKPLMPLMRTATGVDDVGETGGPLPAFDVHGAIASMPFARGPRAGEKN